jgi:hypothetical protein
MLTILVPLSVSDPGNYILSVLFFAPLILLFGGMVVMGISSQFATIVLREDGLLYRHLGRQKLIRWDEIEKWDYPLFVGCCTACACFKMRTGRKHYIPCGGGEVGKALVQIQTDRIFEETSRLTIKDI